MGARTTTLIILAMATGCSFSASCGGKRVDGAAHEKRVKEQLAQLGLNVTKATCPRETPVKVSTSFICQLEIEGKPFELETTITSIEGDQWKGTPRWRSAIPVSASKTAELVAAELTKQAGGTVTVECGTGVVALPPDRRLACTASGPPGKATLHVQFDELGQPGEWKIDEAPAEPAEPAAPPAEVAVPPQPDEAAPVPVEPAGGGGT